MNSKYKVFSISLIYRMGHPVPYRHQRQEHEATVHPVRPFRQAGAALLRIPD
jgi:hypothetical protein